MTVKILLSFICFSTLSCNANELSQLTSALNTLQNLNHKSFIKSFFEIPYSKLHATLVEVCRTENVSLFNKYPDLKDILTFMFKYEYGIYKNDAASIILSLIQTYERIIKTHKPEFELYIVSLAGSDILLHERLLLYALVRAKYNKIFFYSIDPLSPQSLVSFESSNNELADINYKPFKSAQNYISEVIKEEKKIPHVCITITPGTPFLSGTDFNYFGTNNEQEILITPQSLDELSILINPENQSRITELNNKLAQSKNTDQLNLIRLFDPTIKPIMLKYKDTNSPIGQYGIRIFHESVIVDFLEIIKLASLPGKDCIACNCCWYKAVNGHRKTGPLHIVNYKNIAEQSTALLFKETLLYPNDWQTYIYNKTINQFELERTN